MLFKSTSCCGLVELYGMGKVDDPKKHLLSVCKSFWPTPRQPGRKWMTNTIHGSYLFHGVVKFLGKDDSRYSDTAAENLARYIRKNKLGTVVGSKPTPNYVNHPDHVLRMFIWNPHVKNLKAWYAANCPDEDRPPKFEVDLLTGYYTVSANTNFSTGTYVAPVPVPPPVPAGLAEVGEVSGDDEVDDYPDEDIFNEIEESRGL